MRPPAMLTAPSDGQSWTMKNSLDFYLQRVPDGIELYVRPATARPAGRGRAAKSAPRRMP